MFLLLLSTMSSVCFRSTYKGHRDRWKSTKDADLGADDHMFPVYVYTEKLIHVCQRWPLARRKNVIGKRKPIGPARSHCSTPSTQPNPLVRGLSSAIQRLRRLQMRTCRTIVLACALKWLFEAACKEPSDDAQQL